MKKRILAAVLLLLVATAVPAQQRMIDANYYSHHFYLPSLINGQPAHLIFDTGSPYVCLDSIFLAQSGLHYTQVFRAKMGGTGNNVTPVRFIHDELTYTIADKEYKSAISPIFELKPIIGDYADGLLGMTELEGKYIAIDYRGRKLGFWDHLESADTAGYIGIPIEIEKTRIMVPVTVVIREGKRVEGRAQIDLGNGRTLSLTSVVADRYGLEEVGPKKEYHFVHGGVGGEAGGYEFRADSFTIGPFTLTGVMMDYSTNTGGAMVLEDHIGLLGNDILERFDLIIDQKGKMLYFRPNADFGKPYEDYGMGFNYTDRSQTLGCWVVNCLYRGSNAEKAGLRDGDCIIAVDGQSIHEITIEKQEGYFDDKKSLSLTILRDGQQLEISYDFDLPQL